MGKLKYAQDLIKTSNSSIACGFNMFVNGEPEPKYTDGYHDFYARSQGWLYAKQMAKKGQIAFKNRFRCKCGGYPIMYGGFWCCNSCGGKNVDMDWWKIKVEKDGNSYCCHGLDFENIMESENYAFGDTFEQAIDNYESIMRKK